MGNRIASISEAPMLQVIQCLSDPFCSNQLRNRGQSCRTCGHFESEFVRNVPKRTWERVFFKLPFCEINEKDSCAVFLFNMAQVKMFYQYDTTAAESLQLHCSAAFLFSILFHLQLLPTHLDSGSLKFSPCRHSLYIVIAISICPKNSCMGYVLACSWICGVLRIHSCAKKAITFQVLH